MMTNSDEPKKAVNTYVKYTGIGLQMVVIIIVSAWAGQKFDRALHNDKTPYCTLIMSLLGVGMSIYLVLKEVLNKKE